MKTIEEKAEEYALQNFAKIGEVAAQRPWPEFLTKIQEIYKDGAHETLVSQWITPDEREPKANVDFLVLYRTRYKGRWLTIFAVECIIDLPGGYNIFEREDCEVLAWMPIPRLSDELIA